MIYRIEKYFELIAAGFTGSHLCDFLKLQLCIFYSNFLTGSIDNIQHNFEKDNFTFIEHRT